ncbi:hypothetical protein KYB31_15690 [Clostridium felsineum]|uniref:hypothetical protein n=1 Tax=Clostridium felsineum TaxID=36839 RepID=UPI00214D8016|nr:hypothetical protein [Clostridium felsineum]MCR3760420.1 hypothetical protein [Clostridium felsineum]
MIYAILNKLNTSEDLKALLGTTNTDTKIYPLNANLNSVPCITYTDTPISDDGIIKVNRLELRAIDNDYDHLQEVIKTVSGLLIMYEDQTGYVFEDVNIMSCQQNGGGHIEDVQNNIYEKFIYLQIEWRYV